MPYQNNELDATTNFSNIKHLFIFVASRNLIALF